MKTVLTALTAAVLLAACSLQNPTAAAPQAASAAQSVQERNKANALAFYDMAFNQHKVAEATEQFIGAEYWQHNPTVADGGKAFVDAFAPFLKEHPESQAEVKRAAADGDLVMLHVHSKISKSDKGEAVVDIFRFDEQGKIVEHWDVIQAVPEQTASGRSMF